MPKQDLEKANAIYEMKQEGKTFAEIGRRFSMSRQGVYGILKSKKQRRIKDIKKELDNMQYYIDEFQRALSWVRKQIIIDCAED